MHDINEVQKDIKENFSTIQAAKQSSKSLYERIDDLVSKLEKDQERFGLIEETLGDVDFMMK